MAKSNYPFKINGYIYSPGTKKGFDRMQRLGIPRPLFRIEDKLARLLKREYKKFARKLLQDIKNAAEDVHVTMDHSLLTLDADVDDLSAFFEKMQKEDEIARRRMNLAAAANTLEHEWFDNDIQIDDENGSIEKGIDSALKDEQEDYLKRLFSDGSPFFQSVLSSFSIDKRKLFNDNMYGLRALYIQNSMARIAGEQNFIKRAIHKRIMDYVNGQTDTLDLTSITRVAYKAGDHMARMFARDQMQRFNKAITITTYETAGATKVKWVTSHDARVRETHKALDGRVFDIHDLPEEVDDYNCRCGLIPVEWSD